MWVLRKLSASRVTFRRFISMLAIIFLMASFATLVNPTNTYANEGVWEGNTLKYDDNDYNRIPTTGLPAADTNGNTPFAWIDSSASPQEAHVIFVPNGSDDNPFSATTGNLKVFEYTPPSGYTLISGSATTIELSRDLTAQSSSEVSSCSHTGFASLGWILCPITNGISSFVDMVYGLIRDYLEVNNLSMTTSSDNGMYAIWSLMRTVANVVFVIVFLIIVYSQMVSGMGMSNYTIKQILPKLIIAIILVNISYLISALFIDISNLLGNSIQVIFTNIRENYLVSFSALDVSWGDLSTYVLSGGAATGAIAGFISVGTATGGGAGAFAFLILGVLIPVAVSLMVAFIVLFARQALITLMVLLAPLAFVAMILPSTNSLYSKWQKSFMSLLVFFPLFALLFGASQLAGAIIMNGADGRIHMIIMGLAVQMVPLFVTPWMMKLSGGLLGEIAKMVNKSSAGIKKAGKSWAKDRQDYHRQQALARTAARLQKRDEDYEDKYGNSARSWANKAWDRRPGIGRTAYSFDQAKRKREARKKDSEELLQNTANLRHNRELAGEDSRREPRTAVGRGIRSSTDWTKKHLGVETPHDLHSRHELSHHLHKQADAYKNLDHAKHEKHWEQYLDGGRTGDGATAAQQEAYKYRSMLTEEKKAKGVAELYREKLAGQDDETLQGFIHGNDGLKKVIKDTTRHKKTAETYKNIVQKEADTAWEETSVRDANLKSLRLSETAASDSHRRATAEWNKIVEDVRLKGTDSVHAVAGAGTDAATQLRMNEAAKTMQIQTEKAVITEKATGDLKAAHENRAETRYITSSEGQLFSRTAQAYKDELASKQAEETAIVQEWRTKKGAEDLVGEEAAIAKRLREADIVKRTYTRRNEMASDITSQEYAGLVMDDEAIMPDGTETIAKTAGGIAGQAGISQAKATAKHTVISAAGKAVEAEKTLLSQVREQEILGTEDVEGGPGLGAANILDESAERLAAMTSSIAGRYHMASHIQLWKRVGELQRQATGELEAAKASGDTAAVKIAEEKVSKVKDMQQQLMQDKTKTPFGIGDQDLGAANVGDYMGNIITNTRDRITTHMSAKRLATMDPDDLKLLMSLARNNKLTEAELDKITTAYNEWQNDDMLKSSLEDKHRVLLDPIKKHAETGMRDYGDYKDFDTEVNGINWVAVNKAKAAEKARKAAEAAAKKATGSS